MATDVHLDLLDQVRIASPCSMKWEDLEGDGAIRHCGACQLDVYNFSEMTRPEVETIIRRAEGRLCAGFFRRADGTMLMKDCPVGLRAIRMKTARMLGRVAAALGLLVTGGAVLGRGETDGPDARLRTFQPFTSICERLAPAVGPPVGRMILGDVALPPGAGITPPTPPCAGDGGDG